jgi:membrane glycosyltransferase
MMRSSTAPPLVTVPPIQRTPMAPLPGPSPRAGRLSSWLHRLKHGGLPYVLPGTMAGPSPWHRTATLRRLVLMFLVTVQTVMATDFMADVLPYHGNQPLEMMILTLFAILFAWVSVGFWTALLGFVVQIAAGDAHTISTTVAAGFPLDGDARTAVIMPICNENVPRVFAGLRATYESVERCGELSRFDFFVLSDSNDADARIAELAAWQQLCRAVNGVGRVFYRWRQHRIKRKSGNVADFCRRWGAKYRYMVVLDADSVMSGDCLLSLVRLMEANPGAGIIQTAPCATGRETLFARIQQFGNRIYGTLFLAGLHFWQLGESYYWGHNAIIRIAPFVRYCALSRLPGHGPLSGEILSHDFIEAALMRRAGWAVWLAYDLPGSYEETPPTLVDELKRDRRWCQGNLMNFRLILTRGLHPAHRAVLLTGAAAYVSAPLWFLFLLLSTVQLAVHSLGVFPYFTHPFQLFPIWPEWHPRWAVLLAVGTAVLLILPKILAVALVWKRDARDFGGRARLILGLLGETIFSALLAPIRMVFHTQFVVAPLLGRTVTWKSPPREDSETGWGEATRHHGAHCLLGVAWAGAVSWLNPSYLWWLFPVVGALAFSVPISVYSSRVALGRRLRAASLFLIPEEICPPPELKAVQHYVRTAPPLPDFIAAVINPEINALACAAFPSRPRVLCAARQLEDAVQQALYNGPGALDATVKLNLLNNPVALARLHFLAWHTSDCHPQWRSARTGIEMERRYRATA